MNSPSAPDQAIEAAAKAGFDINLIECNLALPIEDVHTGLEVQVRFEQWEDVWLPMFAPVPA